MKKKEKPSGEFGARQADELEARLTDDDRKLLDELADWLTKNRLGAVSMLWLESSKPINLLASAWMIMIRPFISALWNPARWDQAAKLLEERGAIELLLRRLEARA